MVLPASCADATAATAPVVVLSMPPAGADPTGSPAQGRQQ
jgi:hypothetical protein